MFRSFCPLSLAFLSLPLIVGCGGGGSAGDDAAMASLLEEADQIDERVAIDEKQSEIDALAAVAQEKRAEADRLAAIEPSEITNEDMQRGKKIKSSGALSSPLKAGQEAKNKLNILQWQQALQLYTASNNLDPPASEEEFMEKVIEANGLTLEPLIEPYEYFYDVEAVTLLKRVKQEVIDAAVAAAEEAEAALAAAKGEPVSAGPQELGSVVVDRTADYSLPSGETLMIWTSGDRNSSKWVYLWCDADESLKGSATYRVVAQGESGGAWKPLLPDSEVFSKTGYVDEDEDNHSPTIGGAEKLSSGDYLYQVKVESGGQSFVTAGVRFDIP